MPNTTAFASWTFLDYSSEKSTITHTIPEYNVLTFPALLTALGTYRTALMGLSGGGMIQENITTFSAKLNGVAPLDEDLQRERKWQITVRDDTTFDTYRVEIPVARVRDAGTNDPLLIAGTDMADLTQPAWVAFIAAFADVYRTPNGNVGNILSAKKVGRNL